MRVIAGRLKGRRLKTPTWAGLRPTSDKLRETLFNILAPRMAGARVLDGYAGTGAIGIEAVSRGARSVTLVDRDRRAQALIAENLAACGVENLCAIIPAEVAEALDTLQAQPAFEPFDIVVLDPPYAPERRGTLEAILRSAGELLARNGVIVLEHARRDAAPETAGQLVRTRTVDSGDSALSFYELRQPPVSSDAVPRDPRIC
jgi:16S rRNA (guanine(966)-N(2))-methyltransferase RsmD